VPAGRSASSAPLSTRALLRDRYAEGSAGLPIERAAPRAARIAREAMLRA